MEDSAPDTDASSSVKLDKFLPSDDWPKPAAAVASGAGAGILPEASSCEVAVGGGLAVGSLGGKTLLILVNSSMHRCIAPETPSKTRSRSSMASRVRRSSLASCSSVKVGGS